MVFGHAPFALLAGVRSGCCGHSRGIWGWLLRGGALRGGGGLISDFREVFASIGKGFVLAGALSTGLLFYGVLRLS